MDTQGERVAGTHAREAWTRGSNAAEPLLWLVHGYHCTTSHQGRVRSRSRRSKRQRGYSLLTLSPSPSYSWVLPQFSPAASPPVPSKTSEPSPTVSTAAQLPSVSPWSLSRITLGAEESSIWLDTTAHLILLPLHGPPRVA